MNTQTILLATALASLSSTAFAQATDTGTTQAVPYHYGMPLHVAKVIALTEPSTMFCEVVTAQMTYIDNRGQTAEISYRKLSDACSWQS